MFRRTEQRLHLRQQVIAGAPGESPEAEAVLKLLELRGAVLNGGREHLYAAGRASGASAGGGQAIAAGT